MHSRSGLMYRATTDSRAEMFWRHVTKTPTCWLWGGKINRRGYGVIGRRGGSVQAHRESWELAAGRRIPAGFNVCHSCDNPACVNPSHLFIGTAADNVRDRVTKGRSYRKLSDQEVREIRATPESVPRKKLAEQYGVTRMHIWKILNGVQRRAASSAVSNPAILKGEETAKT